MMLPAAAPGAGSWRLPGPVRLGWLVVLGWVAVAGVPKAWPAGAAAGPLVKPLAVRGTPLPSDVHLSVVGGDGAVWLTGRQGGVYRLTAVPSGEWRAKVLLAPAPGRVLGDVCVAGPLLAVVDHGGGLLYLRLDKPHAKPQSALKEKMIMRLLCRGPDEIWAAQAPGLREHQGTVQILKAGRITHSITVPTAELATIGGWLELPERNVVVAATVGGLVELAASGHVRRLSNTPLSALVRTSAGEIRAAGAEIIRWSERGTSPFIFAVPDPEHPGKLLAPGSPIDLAVDTRGHWYLLYPGGLLVVVEEQGAVLEVLTPGRGMPSGANKVAWDAAAEVLLIGSSSSGVYSYSP